MKKIILILTILLIPAICYSQNNYYFNDTVGTVPKRITATQGVILLEHNGIPYQYMTITGYASGELIISKDSVATTANSISIPSGSPIGIFAQKISLLTIANMWMKSASGSINVDIEVRVW